MLQVRLRGDEIRIGRHFGVSFQRTLRIPDDGKTYPLPPGLENFPVRRVSDYIDRVPESWREHGGVFLPMYQREAMWLLFNRPHWRPCAVQVGVGKVNAVSGEQWSGALSSRPQNYLVCPDQPWLDGIKAGEGFIRQFVAMPLGMGYTVESQVTGKEEFGGLQILLFEPRPGLFPERAERVQFERVCCLQACPDMGLGAGGRMRQLIYPDDYGIDTWDRTNTGRVYVHIVNSMAYREITGEEPPATPVSVKTYTQFGLPWFDLYDEGKKDVAASEVLKGVKSVKEVDQGKGFGSQQDDSSVHVPPGNVKKIPLPAQVAKEGFPVSDGSW